MAANVKNGFFSAAIESNIASMALRIFGAPPGPPPQPNVTGLMIDVRQSVNLVPNPNTDVSKSG
jgi:hypothetical protein